MYERQLMGQSAPSGDLSRAMLDTKHWGSLLIKATPYGHCMDETGNYVVRPASSRCLDSLELVSGQMQLLGEQLQRIFDGSRPEQEKPQLV